MKKYHPSRRALKANEKTRQQNNSPHQTSAADLQVYWGLFKIPFPKNYPCAGLGRILRGSCANTVKLHFLFNYISVSFTCFRGCVFVCKRRVYKPQGRGLATHFSTFPVCVCLLHCSFPFFFNHYAKQLAQRSQHGQSSSTYIRACADLARTLRGRRSCFGHISKHMAKTL